MSFNINRFKSTLSSGGARSYLFEVQINLPGSLNAPTYLSGFSNKLTFTCKTTSLPSTSVSNIEIPFRGRKIYYAGNRVFEPWSITVINDEDFLVRKTFERWLAAINGHFSNGKNSGVTSDGLTYQTDAIVRQFSQDAKSKTKADNSLRYYIFRNIFPTEMSPIELSWESDSIQEFSVTFRYDYWDNPEMTGDE